MIPKNTKKHFTNIIILVLITCIAVLLISCTSNDSNSKSISTSVKETKDQIQNSQNQTHQDVENSTQKQVEEISFNTITFDQLHPLDLTKAKPFTQREIRFHNHNFPTIGAFYSDTWRYQVVEFNNEGGKPRAIIDIGNTGDKPLVLTDKNICFILMAASGSSGGNISGSKLHNAPVTIKPNEIKRITLTARHPDSSSLEFRFSGEDYVEINIYDYDEKITDTSPFAAENEMRVGGTTGDYYPRVRSEDVISGNGKFKYLADKVIITDLKEVGSIKRPEKGAILLVKVVLANTTDEVMNINWTAVQATFVEQNETKRFVYTDKEWKALGSLALPQTIKPRQIVEGYIALPFYSGRESHAVLFKSSHGRFVISNLESFPVYRK